MAETRQVRISARVEGGEAIVRTFEKGADAVGGLEGAASSASARLEALEGAGQDAGRGVRRSAEGVEGALQDLAGEASSAGASLERVGERGAQSMQQVSEASEGASRSGGGYNQMLFTMGDAAQDAQYSIGGVANNIGQLVEQASYAQGGLRAFVGSLIGAGGAVFALQVLLAYGDDIAAFFSDTDEEAERLKETIGEVAGELVDLQAEIDSLEFSVSGEENIRSYAENIEAAREEQQAFVEAIEAGASQGVLADLKDDFAQLNDEASKQEQAWALMQNLGVSYDTAFGAVSNVAPAVREVTAALEDQGISVDEQVRKLNALDAESEAAKNKVAALEVTQEAAAAAMDAGAERTKDYVDAIAGADDPIQEATEGLRALREEQERRGFGQVESLAGEVQYLEGAIDALRTETDVPLDTEAFSSLQAAAESARGELEKLQEEQAEPERASTEHLEQLKERGVAQEKQRRQLQLEVIRSSIERERAMLDRWHEEQLALAGESEENRLLVEERYQQRKAALQKREANAEAERQRVLEGLRVAAMEEGQEKSLAQIDQRIDREIERARQKYAQEYPELFAEIERLLGEQRARLRASVEGPLFEIDEEDLQVDLLVDSIAAVDAAIAELQRRFDEVDTQEARGQIARLIEELRGTREEMQGQEGLEPPEDLGEAWQMVLDGKIAPALDATRRAIEEVRAEIERLQAAGQETGELEGLLQDLMQAEAALQSFQAASDVAVDAIGQSFAVLGQALGESIAGIADQTKGIGERLMGVLGEAAAGLGQALISIGTPLLFVPGMQGTAAAYIGGGVALMALGSILGAAASGSRGGGSGGRGQQRGPVNRRVNANESAGGAERGYARGTDSAEAGWALVGEEGPELMQFGGGETVLTNDNTREVAAAMESAMAMGADLMSRPGRTQPRRQRQQPAEEGRQRGQAPSAPQGQTGGRLELVGTSTPAGDIQYALERAQRQQRRQGTDDR